MVRLARGDAAEALLEFDREIASGAGQLYAPEFAMNAHDGAGVRASRHRRCRLPPSARFRRALELFPDHARSLVGLGAALAADGERVAADSAFARAAVAIECAAPGRPGRRGDAGRSVSPCRPRQAGRCRVGAPTAARQGGTVVCRVDHPGRAAARGSQGHAGASRSARQARRTRPLNVSAFFTPASGLLSRPRPILSRHGRAASHLQSSCDRTRWGPRATRPCRVNDVHSQLNRHARRWNSSGPKPSASSDGSSGLPPRTGAV